MKNPFDKPNYWYHISDQLFGDKNGKPFFPRLTESSTSRGEYEPLVPRFCVAPTIQQCMIAIQCSSLMYVYRSCNRISPTPPYFLEEDIDEELPFDHKVTQEGWVVRDCQFKLFGIIRIPHGVSFDIATACLGCENFSKQQLTLVRRDKETMFAPINKKGVVGKYFPLKNLKYP